MRRLCSGAISTMAKGIVKMIKPKPYDPLDIRQLAFDADQAAFFASMQENRERLQGFCNKLFEDGDIIRRLQLLENFEQIKFLGIDLNQHYAHTLATVMAEELELVRKIYLQDRDEPPIPRNMPPLAGRVAWSRNLATRVSKPMETLQALNPGLLTEPAHQKLIKHYNKVGKVLVDRVRAGVLVSLESRHRHGV